MEIAPHKTQIIDTFSDVRDFSFQEKKTPVLDEEQVNLFLDAILDFKQKLQFKTERIFEINARMEAISWLNELDDECLILLNDLISAAKDLRSSLIRQYVSFTLLRKKGIAKEEIKNFKLAIDELKEICDDLESVFFFLPEMPDFVETTKKLSLV